MGYSRRWYILFLMYATVSIQQYGPMGSTVIHSLKFTQYDNSREKFRQESAKWQGVKTFYETNLPFFEVFVCVCLNHRSLIAYPRRICGCLTSFWRSLVALLAAFCQLFLAASRHSSDFFRSFLRSILFAYLLTDLLHFFRDTTGFLKNVRVRQARAKRHFDAAALKVTTCAQIFLPFFIVTGKYVHKPLIWKQMISEPQTNHDILRKQSSTTVYDSLPIL